MEDLKIERIADTIHIIKVLSKLQDQRMPFQGVQISKSLQKIPFFVRFFNCRSESFISMCITAELKQFNEEDDIYSFENNCRYIYVVLEGSVMVKRKNKITKHIIRQFGQFGQTEIIFDIKIREEQIKATTHCKLMAIKQRQLKTVWKKSEEVQKCLRFLKVNNYFECIDLYQKQKLTLFMEKKSFMSNQTLLQKGQKLSSIVFVINGKIIIVKNLNLKNNPSISSNLIIDSIEQMSSYGEYQTVHQKISDIKMIAENGGLYYSLNYKQILESQHPIIKKIIQKALPYPCDQQLQFIFDVKSQLNNEQMRVQRKLNQDKKKKS